MKRALLIALMMIVSTGPCFATSSLTRPYETDDDNATTNKIDLYVQAKLKAKGIEPANLCSDEVFIRRVYLDVIGTLPTPSEARSFLRDLRPEKRAELIDKLLQRDEFADYWALKWCDLLRVKSEFPINLWPNAVQAYHSWVREAIRQNWPYDRFARELLTSSGSNFRVPAVNFYRAVQGRTPSDLARTACLTFMGTRIDKWPEADRVGIEAFFSRVAYKQTGEWKEEIVYLNSASPTPSKARLPGDLLVELSPERDPREVFADWLIAQNNPWFARNCVNRLWSWLFGRGIIHEPDDIRPDNPPSNPELLAYLESELVNGSYDLRRIYRLILNSRTYQHSAIAQSDNPESEALFASYPVRRLEAEVLIDALCSITETGEGYTSLIPEPFTFIPEGQRSIALADGSISSPFLERFGRPARDTGLESERNNQPTAEQRLHLLNSSDIQRRIQRGKWLLELSKDAGKNRADGIRSIYLRILSRYPTQEELVSIAVYAKSAKVTPRQVVEDLAWSLINSKEFLYRH